MPRARWRRRKSIPKAYAPFPVNGFTFTALLVGTVPLVGALTYLPALALGPIVEQIFCRATILGTRNDYDS